MKKYLILIVLVIIYIILGKTLETYQIIIKPAWWTLYGVAWGAILNEILHGRI